MTLTAPATLPATRVRAACVREPRRAYGGGRSGRPAPRPEAVLHAAWRRANAARSRKGEIYRVLYPGRPGDGPGPDFRDAILELPDGTRVRGDVEIHVRPAGWRAHGHDTDPRYNGVAFHVTAEAASGGGAAFTSGGLRIPLLTIRPDEERGAFDGSAALASAAAPARRPDALPIPDVTPAEAGDLRFAARSSGFELAMRRAPPDDVLWAAVLECLGFARNRRGFRRLAERLPWRTLWQAIASGGADDEEAAREMLFWAAGFAAMPPVAAGIGLLSRRKPEWSASSGRPDNRPVRRIGGAAVLAARWARAGGPVRALAPLAAGGDVRALTAAITVRSRTGEGRALIGRGRASEIVVNAVLPALCAWAARAQRWNVCEQCRALYRQHPRLPENAITKEMRRLLLNACRPCEIRGAREQQGLMYLYGALSRPEDLTQSRQAATPGRTGPG